jgi:hypothetical protein
MLRHLFWIPHRPSREHVISTCINCKPLSAAFAVYRPLRRILGLVTQKESSMKSLVLALFLHFGGHVAVAQNAPYPFQWENGTELLLFGSGDLVATNQFLLPLGLEAIPDKGVAAIAVSPGEYKQSNFGPFSMSFAAVMARPIGSTVTENWYFFGLTSSNPDLLKAFGQIWGMGGVVAETEVTIGWGVPWNEAKTYANGNMILQVFMADRNLPPQENAAYHFDVFSSKGEGGLIRYHHDCTGSAQNKFFDERKGDKWWADPAYEIGRGLEAMKFVPVQWSLYRTNFGGFTAPSFSAGDPTSRLRWSATDSRSARLAVWRRPVLQRGVPETDPKAP